MPTIPGSIISLVILLLVGIYACKKFDKFYSIEDTTFFSSVEKDKIDADEVITFAELGFDIAVGLVGSDL